MSFYALQRATWHVPPDLVDVSRQGAVATPPASPIDPPDRSTIPLLHPHMKSTISRTSNFSAAPSPGGISHVSIMKEAVSKVIPKKRVKGNEAAVWGEMDVLQGPQHGSHCLAHLVGV